MTDKRLSLDRRTALKLLGITALPGTTTAQQDGSGSVPTTCTDYPTETLTVNGEPLSYPDLPKENDREARGHQVLYDEDDGLYKMWIGWEWGDGRGSGSRVYYYESEDGVDWSEPEPTNVEHSGWEKRLTLGSVLKPERLGRYVMILDRYWFWSNCSGWGGRTYVALSDDGVDWADYGVVSDEEAFSAHRGRPKLVQVSDNKIWLYGRTSGDGNCDSQWWRYESSIDGPKWRNEQELTLDGKTFSDSGGSATYIEDVEVSPDGSRVFVYGRRKGGDKRQLIKAESPIDDGVNFTTVETLVDDLESEECGGVDHYSLGGVYRSHEDEVPYYVVFNNEDEHSYRLRITSTPPTASFSVSTESVRSGVPITFDATASEDPDGEITSYEWDFGDGTSSESADPVVEHTYEEGGVYEVSLTVVNNNGLTDEVTQELTVRQSLVIDIKPESGEVAPINPDSTGVTPVAVLTTENFNPIDRIDIESLRFGPPDVVGDGEGAKIEHDAETEDVNADSKTDFVLHFSTTDTGFQQGDKIGKVVGETVEGIPVMGIDDVRIVGNRNVTRRRNNNGDSEENTPRDNTNRRRTPSEEGNRGNGRQRSSGGRRR